MVIPLGDERTGRDLTPYVVSPGILIARSSACSATAASSSSIWPAD